MFTKPLTHPPIATFDFTEDLHELRRLLLAAALSPRFCAALLNEPVLVVREGFGGEQFLISDATLKLLSSIRVSTLPDFINQLDENLSNRLLARGQVQVAS